MDPQKLRPLAVIILALLREGDMHPYEMIRTLRQRHNERFVRVQNGTFYHQVGTLVRDGFLTEVGTDREGNLPERTTYSLRQEGFDALAAWVRTRLPQFRDALSFRVALAEAHNLPAAEVAQLLDERIRALEEELDALRTGIADAMDDGVDRQYLIEFQHRDALLSADLAWTETFRDELRAGALPWAVHRPGHPRPSSPGRTRT